MRLVADNLAGERGDALLFQGVHFTLEPGQTLIITGANGAGKSTLLRIVAGLLPASSGAVFIDSSGSDEAETDLSVGTCSHYLSSLNAMKPTLSVDENLRFWQHFHGHPLYTIEDALERVELYGIGHLPYGYLSTGQKRRVALATLLCSYRPIWLLDEPTSGLDSHAQQMFAQIMRDYLREGGMVVAVTHIALGLETTQGNARDNQVRQLCLEDYLPLFDDGDAFTEMPA